VQVVVCLQDGLVLVTLDVIWSPRQRGSVHAFALPFHKRCAALLAATAEKVRVVGHCVERRVDALHLIATVVALACRSVGCVVVRSRNVLLWTCARILHMHTEDGKMATLTCACKTNTNKSTEHAQDTLSTTHLHPAPNPA
jgi:hypothetical protein